MRLPNFIVPDAIIPALATSAADVNPKDAAAVAGVKERVVRELVGALQAARAFGPEHTDDVVKEVMRREQLGTTGIGRNIAIPHSRHAAAEKLIGALGIAPAGLPFDSLDGEPVYVFVLLVSPKDRPGDHLRALEAVVRTMRNEDFVKQLRACTTKAEVWNLLEAAPGL
ncbi:PTS sugar transporter subunit IIA [Urbifossiella limnaea]|uniref:PTS system mannose-specific EIIBCA component n=1 Tax=Urbifossiella limnaea TaxID=2528023 RepID=A0A517XTD4_9BACT|nr:PTS sugar transporter subunit IIA [Urbifossiella limnaea]QDU20757.1 PTS system mannose-specific EIIBCA component [Urbifossiella limnaea]